jgi:FtsZ-binding cell division protein ZapB
VHTRLRQLEHDMEQLTLSNVRLLRTNRILKLDCDRLVDEQTQTLKQEIQELRRMNVQLQRSNRLLQDDMAVKTVRWRGWPSTKDLTI